MGNASTVIWEKRVAKQLARLPLRIEEKFYAWAKAVKTLGIQEVRKRSGFHDEPLMGERSGQRSVRLSRAYRVIYIELLDGRMELIEVIEVNKHDY
jgi:proteic killer suppression protein